MRQTTCCALLVVVMWAGGLCGCGKGPELIPGAEAMSDEEKLEQVRRYCDQWVSEAEAVLQRKELPPVKGLFEGVKPHPKGCDIELEELSYMLGERLWQSEMFILSTSRIGQIKAEMLYRKSITSDPMDAECAFTLTASPGPGKRVFVKTYRPDPRIFAVFLPD